MVYNKQHWENFPSEATPLTAARLRHLETQYDEAISDSKEYTDETVASVEMDLASNLIDDVEINESGDLVLTQRSGEIINAGRAQGDSVVEFQAYVDNAVDEVINSSIEVQDPVVSALILDEVSATYNATIGTLSSFTSDARQYGFVADYVGTPQYDGLDGSRVTCTDNTPAFEAMLDDAIQKGELTVHFPPGHYGFTDGNIVKNMAGVNLTLIGDGQGETVFDYVKEDATHTATVFPDTANAIATLRNLDSFTLKDMTVKATTNYNNVSGDQTDLNAVYFGAVWGFIVDGAKTVNVERTLFTRFNFRGLTVMNSTPGLTENITTVTLKDCRGIANKGSGYWIDNAKLLTVDGGEFAYNGQAGTIGTGYGVTGSQFVDEFQVRGAYFHHNYRKGFDTHGGMNGVIQDTLFEDNVLHDIALANWHTLPGGKNITIKDIVIKHGESPESVSWLTDQYVKIKANGFTQGYHCIWINDANSAGVQQAELESITFDGVLMNGAFNYASAGDIGSPSNITIQSETASLNIFDSYFDYRGRTVGDTAYRASLWGFACPKTTIRNTHVKWLEDTTWAPGEVGAVIVITGAEEKTLTVDRTTFELNNARLLATTGAGAFMSVGGVVKRTFRDVKLDYVTIPYRANSTFHFGRFYLADGGINLNNVIFETEDNRFEHQIPKGMESLGWSGSLATAISFDAFSTDANLFEVVVDGYAQYHTLEVMFLGEQLIIRNDAVTSDATSYTLQTITRDTRSDGKPRSRFIFKAKTGQSALTTETVRATYNTADLSWGVYEIVKAV